MNLKLKTLRSGVTMVELIITMAVSSVLALSVGALLVGGQRGWQNAYKQVNSNIRQDSQAIMYTFGSIGRKSNRLAYTLYDHVGGSYIPSEPQTENPEEVVHGDAVEFRYWDVSEPDSSLLDVTNFGTNYAFFYMDGDELKVDYGESPPGAVPGGSGTKNESDIRTVVLAENATANPNGLFNHTTVGGVGQGCVRISLTLEDEDDPNETLRVLTATLARNVWPR